MYVNKNIPDTCSSVNTPSTIDMIWLIDIIMWNPVRNHDPR